MEKLSGEELKKWISNDNNLHELYHELLPSLISHVKKNGGSEQEAIDLFQESLVVLFKKANDTDFQLTASINTYVFAIAKRMWLAELRKKRNKPTEMKVSEEEDGNEIEEMIINHEKQELYLKHFRQLSEGCRKILKLFFHGEKMKEIANMLGFASEGYARKRKHQCQESLVKAIQGDPVFMELRNG